MDQEVLPGVGNIIKNEACFNAAVNPLSLIKDVSEGVIRRLVRRTREFSIIFYQCRKTGKPLSKHYKMYRFSECAECGTRVTKCHPGEYKRGTYFCPRCQDNREQMVAKKGSLLGWATTSSTPTRPTWQCGTCTLENKGNDITCAACGSKAQSQGNPSTTSWDCSACTLTNKAGNLTCAACGGPRQEGQENEWAGFGIGLKRKRENEDDQGTTMARGEVLGSKRDLTLNDSKTINDNHQPAKKTYSPLHRPQQTLSVENCEPRGSQQAPPIPLLCSPKGQAVPTLFLGGSAPPQVQVWTPDHLERSV